jgi:hypothetical protein
MEVRRDGIPGNGQNERKFIFLKIILARVLDKRALVSEPVVTFVP